MRKPENHASDVDQIDWASLRDQARRLHEAREKVLAQCRTLGQLSAKSIRHVHRGEFPAAVSLLSEARALALQIRELQAPHAELSASYLHDTEKEMVEAAFVIAIASCQRLPKPAELGTQTMTYLHGACEAASEVRRLILDKIRAGAVDEAERILRIMEEIYEELITFDFPDSLTHGLRRSVDALRAVLERTRSDITLTLTQQRLVQRLESAEEAFKR